MDIKSALSILGKDRVFSAEETVSAWNRIINEKRTEHDLGLIKINDEQTVVPYAESDIVSALEKKAQDGSWGLFYDLGFSVCQMRAILGDNRGFEPNYQFGNDWLFLPEDGVYGWPKETVEPAYFLISMRCFFADEASWFNQSHQIKKMGARFRRASTRLAVLMQTSYFLMRGNYLFEYFWHWGPETEEIDKRKSACLSMVGRSGVKFCNWICLEARDKIGVIVYMSNCFYCFYFRSSFTIFSNISGLFSAKSANIFLSISTFFSFNICINLLYGNPNFLTEALILICQRFLNSLFFFFRST